MKGSLVDVDGLSVLTVYITMAYYCCAIYQILFFILQI